MCHQLVGLLAGGIQAQRVVDILMDREGHRGIGAIDTGTAGVNQMFDVVMAAAFQDVGKTDDVAVDVGQRIGDRVAHPGLGGQVDDALRPVGGKGGFDVLAVTEVNAQVCVVGVPGMVGVASQPRLLDGGVVVIVVVVDADDVVAPLQQTQDESGADESGSAGNEDFHGFVFGHATAMPVR